MLHLFKILSLIFAVVMLVNCFFTKPAQTVPVTVEGAIFAGNNDDDVSVDLEFDTKWITKADNRIYNSALASFSAILCDDVYFRSKDVAKNTQNRVLINGEEADYTATALLEKLGYTDVKYIESFKQKTYAGDSNDSVTMLMAYKDVDEKYDSFIFVLRGCFSAGERLSSYDIGCNTDNYTLLTGTHSEWINKNNFKGIDIASNRAMEFISDYINEHDDPERRNTAFTTGHSRGASLANVIGAKFEDDENIKSYTYTFNTMVFTTDVNAPTYKTIFNIFDKNDYYSNPLPFGKEKMFRYGTDISVNIAESEVIKNGIAELKGRDDYTCMPVEAKAEYDSIFSENFPDKASLYEMKTKTETFDTVEEMNTRFGEINGDISSLAMGGFVSAEKDEAKKTITVTYCGASLLIGLAQIQGYGEAAYTVVISLFDGDAGFCRLCEITQNNLDGITGSHLLINGYMAAKNTKFVCF